MEINNLHDLGNVITQKLNNGLKLIDLKNEILNYTGNDWKKYVSLDDEKYTRNIIFTNDKIEIILICWNNRQSSCIHDHPDYGCLFRILDGELHEYVYVFSNDNNIKISNINVLSKNQLSYKQGNKELHTIINNKDSPTMSLHIYCPPNYKPNIYKQV